jgi:hypothetical protein
MPYNIIQGDGTPASVPDFNPNGRAAQGASAPVVLSNEDKAAIDTLAILLAAVRDRLPAGGVAADASLLAVRDRLPQAGAASEATLAAILLALYPPARSLGAAINLAAGAASAPITQVVGASYLFEAIFTGTGLVLQRLGPDDSTWINAGTLNASGSIGVVLGANDTVRLFNSSNAGIAVAAAGIC